MFRIRAAAKNLMLDLDISPDVPEYLDADAGKIRQVLINMLGNAVKFTDQGGITVRVGLAEQGAEKDGYGLYIEVLIPDAALPMRIFRPCLRLLNRLTEDAGIKGPDWGCR